MVEKKVGKTMKLWYRAIKVWRLECGEVFRLFVPEINVQIVQAWFFFAKKTFYAFAIIWFSGPT